MEQKKPSVINKKSFRIKKANRKTLSDCFYFSVANQTITSPFSEAVESC